MRTRGGLRKRFKDTAKHYMKKGQININTWERMATDRLLAPYHIHGNGQCLDKPSTSRGGETEEGEGEGDVPTSSSFPSVWHLLPTLQQDLQITNRDVIVISRDRC